MHRRSHPLPLVLCGLLSTALLAQEIPKPVVTLGILERRKAYQESTSRTFQAFHGFKYTNHIERSGIEFSHQIVDDAARDYKAAQYDHGFPVVDFKVRLIDGSYHDVDSSVLAFEIAAKAAFKEAMAKAGPQLLEPVMKVEVVTPEEYMGDVIGDINSRRGQINAMEDRGNAKVVTALVPLASMFGYINDLRSKSQGRAQYTMQFDHYEPVPANVAEQVKEKYA